MEKPNLEKRKNKRTSSLFKVTYAKRSATFEVESSVKADSDDKTPINTENTKRRSKTMGIAKNRSSLLVKSSNLLDVSSFIESVSFPKISSFSDMQSLVNPGDYSYQITKRKEPPEIINRAIIKHSLKTQSESKNCCII